MYESPHGTGDALAGFGSGLVAIAPLALLLPLASAVLLYRSRDQILDRVGAWWPLLERLWPLNGLYRALDGLSALIGSLIWGGTQVIEGAGYMAWVVLACLVIFLLVLRQT